VISRLGYVALGRCNNGNLSGMDVPRSSHTGASNGGSLERSMVLHGVDDTGGAWHTARPILPPHADCRVC
jgi:hypothetical protein